MKAVRSVVIFLLLFVSINALVAGALLIRDPSGSQVGMPGEILRHSPFSDFLVPGIILFVVNGLLNILALVVTIKESKDYPVFVLIQGVLLTGWIVIQVFMLRDMNFLHSIMLSIGLIMVGSGMWLNSGISK